MQEQKWKKGRWGQVERLHSGHAKYHADVSASQGNEASHGIVQGGIAIVGVD